MITVPAGVQTAIQNGTAKVRFWWRVDTSPVTAIWNGKHDITVNSQVYTAAPWAQPPKFAPMGSELGVRSTTVELWAPTGLLDQFFDTVDIGLDIVRTGFWIVDDSGAVLFERRLHRGRVDNLEIVETLQDIGILKVTSTSRVADARRDGGRIASDNDQRRRDSNDGFFKQMAGAQDIEIVIGGRGAVPVSSAPVSGGGRYQDAYYDRER